jgi:hypothetical protein
MRVLDALVGITQQPRERVYREKEKERRKKIEAREKQTNVCACENKQKVLFTRMRRTGIEE